MASRQKDPLSRLVGEIAGSAEKALRQRIPLPDSVRLYHYTSAQGLLGIISDNVLRFSDPLFLNDGSEVFYANDLLNRALADFVALRLRSEQRYALRVMNYVVRTAVEFRPVVFCMSAKPDLLNQWRDYGKDIVPYCVEFSAEGLLTPDWSFRCDLVKLIYDEAAQVAILQALFERVLKALSKHPPQMFARSKVVLNAILSEVWGVLVQFKNPAYAAEEEWRLLGHAAYVAGQPVHFRASTLGVVPYLERHPRAATLLPVVGVWVGPSPWGQYSRMALERYLRSTVHAQAETAASSIPAR